MVVSLANVSPNHASVYYTTGDRLSTRWSGKLAQELQLDGKVEPQHFVNLLNGKTANGLTLLDKLGLHSQQATAQNAEKRRPRERAALDVTASAPKSVSLQALIFGDEQIEEAHRQANQRMLQTLEAEFAFTRITQAGKRIKMPTGELVIASFHHDISRALDPQLHTHNLVMNLQRSPKTGRWQTLDNTQIFKAKMLLGQLYLEELAQRVQALGYRILRTNQSFGFWEIEGFSFQHIQAFSQRTEEIRAIAPEGSSRKTLLRAKQLTRSAKQEESRLFYISKWQEQAAQLGMTKIYPSFELLEGTYDLSRTEAKYRGFGVQYHDDAQVSEAGGGEGRMSKSKQKRSINSNATNSYLTEQLRSRRGIEGDEPEPDGKTADYDAGVDATLTVEFVEHQASDRPDANDSRLSLSEESPRPDGELAARTNKVRQDADPRGHEGSTRAVTRASEPDQYQHPSDEISTHQLNRGIAKHFDPGQREDIHEDESTSSRDFDWELEIESSQTP